MGVQSHSSDVDGIYSSDTHSPIWGPTYARLMFRHSQLFMKFNEQALAFWLPKETTMQGIFYLRSHLDSGVIIMYLLQIGPAAEDVPSGHLMYNLLSPLRVLRPPQKKITWRRKPKYLFNIEDD